AAQGLWAAHQARMAARAEAARAPRADLRVSDRDPFALRHAALLALAAGLIAQLDDGSRLAEALVPVAASPAQAAMAPQPSLEAWASPPAYTRMAPLYLTERRGEAAPIRLPVGSEIVIRVFDVAGAPRVEGAPAGMTTAFSEAQGGWTATMTLTGDADILVTAPGTDFGGWSLRAIPDHPPSVEIAEPPVATRGGALQFGFGATDDYGVALARATVALDGGAEGPRGLEARTVFEAVGFDLPLPLTGSAREVAETVVENLTENPWAGLPVTLTLTVEDAAGQQAETQAALILPERRFFNPLARALIEQRRELAWSTDAAERVRDVIDAISAHPDDIFTDAAAYLTVRTAMRRLETGLRQDRVADETPGVVDLLWQAAVRIEDGSLSDAERRLREIQQELSDAIERGAEDDEIARLMDELRQALNDYLRQLAEQAMQNPQDGQQQPMDPGQMLSQQDLMDMLDQLEQAMRDGMQDLAQQMLEQLAQLLENLQMAQPGQQQGGQGQGDQTMQELQDMIGRQQGLADRSFDALRQGRQGQNGEGQQQGQGEQGQQPGQGGQPGGRQPGGGLGDIARDQEALRQLLED
ncbi:MAG: TIGR02302 family protein, partial [Rubrimonas sp.]